LIVILPFGQSAEAQARLNSHDEASRLIEALELSGSQRNSARDFVISEMARGGNPRAALQQWAQIQEARGVRIRCKPARAEELAWPDCLPICVKLAHLSACPSIPSSRPPLVLPLSQLLLTIGRSGVLSCRAIAEKEIDTLLRLLGPVSERRRSDLKRATDIVLVEGRQADLLAPHGRAVRRRHLCDGACASDARMSTAALKRELALLRSSLAAP
jgi:hypothetical protein